MKKMLLLAVACVALAGCASADIKAALGNLDKDCERHYSGSFGGLAGIGAQANFQIDCKASGTTTTTTVTVVPANPASVPSGQ